MSPEEAAQWMLSQIEKKRCLYQDDAANALAREEKTVPEADRVLTYFNDAGNLCISPRVLTAFRKLDPANVVWERGDKSWRRRSKSDAPGRRQD